MLRSDASRRVVPDAPPIAGARAVPSDVALLQTRIAFPVEVFAVLVDPLIDGLGAPGWRVAGADVPVLPKQSVRRVLRALAVRRDRILPPNAPPERVGDLAHRWTYAVFVAAMLRPERGTGPDASAKLFELVVPEVGRRWLDEDPAVSAALAEVLAGWACPDNPIEAILEEATSGSAFQAAADDGVESQRPVVEADALEVTSSPLAVSASDFFSWLRDSAAAGSVEINTAGAMVHRVPDGVLLIWPDAFRAFLTSRPGDAVSGRALKRLRHSVFETGWHLRGAGGIVVHDYGWRDSGGAGDTVSGVVIVEADRVFDPLPPLNPSLVRIEGKFDSVP